MLNEMQYINISDKIYTVLCVIFTTLIVIDNMIFEKFVYISFLSLYTFELSVGALLYPLTFLMTDLIAEFYGKTKATFCVQLAMVINIVVACIIFLMDKMDATPWSKVSNDIFHQVFGLYHLAFIASLIACYISQVIDITLYLWIRRLTNNKLLWLRNNASTTISLFIDTCIVISLLTLFDVLPVKHFTSLILNSYLFKLIFTICSTPIFYASVAIIKRIMYTHSVSAEKF